MQDIIDYLDGEGFSLCAPLRKHGPVVFQGELKIEDHRYRIEIRFFSRQYDFPEVVLIDYPFCESTRKQLGFRHISSCGKICHTDESQTWWDSANAVRLTCGILEQVKELLIENLCTSPSFDYFFRDFAGYWDSDESIYLSSYPHNTQVFRCIKEDRSERTWLVSREDSPEWLRGKLIEAGCSWLTMHLRQAPLPKVDRWPPNSYRDIENWLKSTEPNAAMYVVNVLKRHLFQKSKAKTKDYPGTVGILFTWSKNGEENLLGGAIKFDIPKIVSQAIAQNRLKQAVIILRRCNPKIKRFSIDRADSSYIQKRNLPIGTESMKNKRIVMVGAGSIGGYLSNLLCSNGAGWGSQGQFHIIDLDIFSSENIGRHFLGMDAMGKLKVHALKQKLSSAYPYLNIKAHPNHVMQRLEILQKADIIVDATGSQTVGISLSEFIPTLAEPPTIIHSWIQGHGIATGVLLNSDKSHACYRCLWLLKKDNYEPRYQLSKESTSDKPVYVGCHKSYFPYLASTAMAAATQASQMLLDFLNGTVVNNLRFNILDQKKCYQRKDTLAKSLKDCPFCKNLPK